MCTMLYVLRTFLLYILLSKNFYLSISLSESVVQAYLNDSLSSWSRTGNANRPPGWTHLVHGMGGLWGPHRSSSLHIWTMSTMESSVPSHLSFIYVPPYKYCVCVLNLWCLIQFTKRLKKYSGFIEYFRCFFLMDLQKTE